MEAVREAVKSMDRMSSQPSLCVLRDFNMPELDGQDILRLMHGKYPKIPVIICSGYIDMDNSDFVREGAFEILHKPFDHQALLEIIRRAVMKDEDKTLIAVEGYDLRKARDIVSRKIIIKALTKCDFKVTKTAGLLGIIRQYLIRHMKRDLNTR